MARKIFDRLQNDLLQRYSSMTLTHVLRAGNMPPEFIVLENLLSSSKSWAHQQILAEVDYHGEIFPLHGLRFGTAREGVPVLFFIGGIHGIERIGAQVVLAFLDNFVQRLQWDDSIKYTLENLRIWFVPIANPVGLKYNLRSNGNHVDLMRNAPVDADSKVTPLVGGQRLSHFLPWFRGDQHGMELESSALCDLVLSETEQSPLSLLLDVHSGFGTHDRLWFPLASSHHPIEHLPEYFRLYSLLKQNYPNHKYIFEPQSANYLTHGDLWDYCYLRAGSENRLFLPLTLEMGSWRWLKKNPLQLSPMGIFNPIKPHRLQRTLRGHLTLMEFLIRASRSWRNWIPRPDQREDDRRSGMEKWYYVNE